MTIEWTFRLGDGAIVFATLFGPVLAVQAQKWIERTRERKQRQIGVFRTLMATRAEGSLPAHIEALNAVPIEFYRNKKIVDSWKEYLDYLYRQGVPREIWIQRRMELFVELMFEMSAFLSYSFTRVEISREVHPPDYWMQARWPASGGSGPRSSSS